MRVHEYLTQQVDRGDSVGDLARNYVEGVRGGLHGRADTVLDLGSILARLPVGEAVFRAVGMVAVELAGPGVSPESSGRGRSRYDDPTDLGLPPLPPESVHDCVDGWLQRDCPGGPRPCPVCKPHLRWVLDPRTGRGRWELQRARKGRRA